MGFFASLFGKTDNTALTRAIREGVFLVDVRTPAEFSSGSINGAVNIPLDKLPSSLAKFKGKKSIVVFCRSGNRSSQAKAYLERQGFADVINGGTWQNVKKIIEG